MNYPLHIAVIEDGSDWQHYIQHVLHRKNYFRADQLYSWGEEFFEKYRERRFDLVLLDVNLPVSDGYAVLKRIKSIMPKIPVVVFTSSDNNQDIVRFTNCAIDAYINKVRLQSLNEDLLMVMKLRACRGYRFQPLRDEDLQMLHLICSKLSYEQIADMLGITKKCVENRVVRLCEKLYIDHKKLDIYEFCVKFGFWNPWAPNEHLAHANKLSVTSW